MIYGDQEWTRLYGTATLISAKGSGNVCVIDEYMRAMCQDENRVNWKAQTTFGDYIAAAADGSNWIVKYVQLYNDGE